MTRVRVLVLQHGLGALDYAVPPDLDLTPGDIVEVPLGPRAIVGVVWEAERRAAREVPDAKLRAVVRRFDVPAMTTGLRRLVEWTGAYYLAPPAAVLRMALSVPAALEAAADIVEYRLAGKPADTWAEGVARLLADRGGEIAHALHHPDIGAIDVIYGDATGGLCHIAAKHPGVIADLPRLIAAMTLLPPSGSNRVRLESAAHLAMVRLDYDGRAKRWLLAAFEKGPATPEDGRGVAGGRDGSPGPGLVDRVVESPEIGNAAGRKLSPQRAQAVERLGGRQGAVRELARHAGVSDGVIRGMVKAGLIVPLAVNPDVAPPVPDPDFAQPVLSDEQAVAAHDIAQAVAAGGFAPFVLDGVTGSGKTEVYFEGIAAALRVGADGADATGQILVLVPEIALTAPWLARFAARFGCAPVAWHSDLRGSERRRAWRAVASGDARVVIGARSALFLPFAQLALIVVDEAHESSFKQDDGVQYHGRDVAVMRAQIEAIPVVLATATPAIETQVQVARGRYAELKLPTRFGGAQLPRVETIDLRTNPPPRGHWLSPPLFAGLRETFVAGEQSLLFLNRRGYAPLTLCRTCGERIECPQCTAWLVEHRLTRRLQCHHCGYTVPVPTLCPACGIADSLVPCGPGVERVAEEVARVLPDLRVALVTSDTIFSPARAAALVDAVDAGVVDLLIGTQLVTKGYHFPNLTLVGVVDADLGLAGGDLRAGERTFQQIAQVSGRAGRGARPGRVLLQTHQPHARIMRALVEYDAEGFYAAETDARRDLGLPPFGRLAGVVVSGEDGAAVTAAARALGHAAPVADGLSVLGPAPAPLAMLRGRHRQRLLVHARRSLDLQGIIAAWLEAVAVPPSVRVTVDIDPYSFL